MTIYMRRSAMTTEALLRTMAKEWWAIVYEHSDTLNAAAAELEAVKEEVESLVNGSEYQAMQRTLAEVNARLAEAEALLLQVSKGGYPHGMATLLLDIDAFLAADRENERE